MGKVIGILNQKGGTSKTTTTISAGAGLQRKGNKVLLVDCDPQGSLTMGFGYEPDELQVTLSDLMLQKINDDSVIIPREQYILKNEGLDIIPADIKLSGVENSMVNILSREFILRDILDELRNDYGYILLDCPPSLGMITVNALAAADSVIIPVQAQYLSLKGMELLLKTISRVKRQINKGLIIEGILLTMYNQRTNLSKEVKAAIEENYGQYIRIFNSVINYSIRAAETPAHGMSIFKYDPNGPIAESYAKMVEEMIGIE